MSGDETPKTFGVGQAEGRLQTHPLVRKVLGRSDDSQPRPSIKLIGYIGPSQKEYHVRLYVGLDLQAYYDLPVSEIVHVEPTEREDEDSPTLVLISAAAEVKLIKAEIPDPFSGVTVPGDSLPAHIDDELSRLDEADDETIRVAARSHLSPETAVRIEELHWKRQRQGLTQDEIQILAGLMEQYERTMLIRAHAAALWKQRGHDPSELLSTG